MEEFQLSAGIVASQTYTSDGSGVEGESVSCGVTGTSNIADTEEWKQVPEVRFAFVNEFEGGGEHIVNFQRKVIRDLSRSF